MRDQNRSYRNDNSYNNNGNNIYQEFKPWGLETNEFCMAMHLSQFAGFMIPIVGLILPVIMWTTNNDKSHLINVHGKNIINWIISYTIYMFVASILILALIGIPILFTIIICSVIFTIVGAIKALHGEVYRYPFTINFIK